MSNLEADYRRYAPMVLRRCRQLLRDDDAALDALQDVFVSYATRSAPWWGTARSSLLNRMATNACLNRLKASGLRDRAARGLLASRAEAEDPLERLSLSAWLSRALGREPTSTRVMAVLHWVDGLTLEETAREVGLSVSGVRKRLSGLQARMRATGGEL